MPAECQAILAELKEWSGDVQRTLPQKQKLAEAMRYALSRWSALRVDLNDGRVEIDNNIAKRAITKVVVSGNKKCGAILTSAAVSSLDRLLTLNGTKARIVKAASNGLRQATRTAVVSSRQAYVDAKC